MSDANSDPNAASARAGVILLGLALLIAMLIALAKFYLIHAGALEIGLEGDEGVRIQIAGRLAESWSDIFGFVVDKWAAIHPPGDMALRAIFFKCIFALAPGMAPVSAALYLSCGLSLIGAVLLTLATYRAGGGLAALLFAILLGTSWQFHNPSLSGMGEGTMFVFFAAEIYLLTEAILRKSTRWLFGAALAALAASFMRPEPVFLLPGLCLALWFAMGFWKAAWFGAIASGYLIAKTVIPLLLTPGATTILNFSKLYTFTGMPLWKFQYSNFGKGLLHDQFYWSIALLLAGLVLGGISQWRDYRKSSHVPRADMVGMALVLGAILYLAITVTAVIIGKTANSSVRLGYLPSYLLQMAAAIGIARFFMSNFGERLRPLMRVLSDKPAIYGISALAAAVILIGAGVVAEARVIARRGHDRAPLDAIAVRDWVLANTRDGEGIVLDRMWNRENWMVGYLARRSDVCAYFYCKSKVALLSVPRPAGEICGVHGLACIYRRIQAALKSQKPRWLVAISGKLSSRWLGVQRSVYGNKDGTALWSFIYPYATPLQGEAQISDPTNTAFTERKMTLEDGYAFTLKPHFQAGDFVVYEAVYP